VTRSLGDADLRATGVLAAPEITTHELGEEDEFVILASDGLWDKLSNEDAVALVHDTVKEPDMAATRLATEALTRGAADNITVVVCFFKAVSGAAPESVYKGGAHKYAHTSAATTAAAAAQAPSQNEVQDGY